MSELRAGIVGVDITPRFHPEFGAWGTSPTLPELDVPLLGRWIAPEREGRGSFIEELRDDPAATWFCGINLPEQLSVEHRVRAATMQIGHYQEALRGLDAGVPPPTSMPITLGAVRIGDVAAVISPGENFTAAGMKVRARSPFVHTLICGDTNGLFGYLGDDAEIDRGGYETDSFWKALYFGGFRLAPAKGTADRIVDACVELLWGVRGGG